MKVFNVIDQNSDIFGKKLIEASAGTGKTFAIEHLFVRLLLEKSNLNIEEILVVTFTNSATKELKFRIRKNLEKAIKILKSKTLGSESIFLYLSQYIGQKEKISKLEDALDLFELANIFTIHSFCFRALKEFSFEADVLIDIDEKNDIFLIKDIILDFLKYSIDSKKYLPEQIEILVNQQRDIETLVLKIFQNLGSANLDLTKEAKDLKGNRQNYLELFDSFKNCIQNYKSMVFEEISPIYDFDEIFKNFKKIAKYKNDDFSFQLISLQRVINKTQKDISIDDFKIFIENKLSVFEFLDEKNKKNNARDYELPKVLKDFKSFFYPIIKRATDSNILFANLTSDIANFVDDFLEKNEIFTFDKILQKMQKACKSQSFLQKMKNRYKAAIIDEFQDTDPIQFDIFSSLFLKNENILAFYLIGDPKQSIYSFRKADLYTYLEATKKIDEINYLDTNYRSTKPLIDSLNAIFSKEFSKNWLKLPNIDSSLEYIPIKAGLDEKFDFHDDLAPIHFFLCEGNKIKKWPTDEMEKFFFIFITNEILRLKKEEKFLNKNFAVLVKDRYQAQRLKSYFQKFAINSQTSRATSLKNSICLKAMREFLDASLHPNNLNKVKIALLGPFIHMSLEGLKNIESDEFSKYLEKFHFFKSILNKKNLSLFFHHFFEMKFQDFSILENIAIKKDINFYLDTIFLIELILAEKNLGPHNLLSFFEKIELLDQDDEKLKILQNFEDGVHILTTFMSKGLEYEIVFALDLASKSKSSDRQGAKELDAEKMRQFYVALTRAKYRMYVPIAIDLKEKLIEDGTFSSIEYFLAHILDTENKISKINLLEKLDILKDKNQISYNFVNLINPINFQEIFQEIQISKPKDFTKKYEPRYRYSFSSLSSHLNLKTHDKKQKSALPKGAEVGEVFHKILENIFYKKSFQSADILKTIQDHIKDSELQNFETEVFSIIDNTLKAPLLGENSFCLKDVDFMNFQPEVEFLFSWKKDYLKGFIDLVFEYQAKYYIIDWKSNFLGDFSKDYDTKNIENEMNLHNYYLQAAIYTKSLKRHLKVLNKDFQKVFGGAFYIFLRGQMKSEEFEDKAYGIHHFYPDLKMLNQIHNQKVN